MIDLPKPYFAPTDEIAEARRKLIASIDRDFMNGNCDEEEALDAIKKVYEGYFD